MEMMEGEGTVEIFNFVRQMRYKRNYMVTAVSVCVCVCVCVRVCVSMCLMEWVCECGVFE